MAFLAGLTGVSSFLSGIPSLTAAWMEHPKVALRMKVTVAPAPINSSGFLSAQGCRASRGARTAPSAQTQRVYAVGLPALPGSFSGRCAHPLLARSCGRSDHDEAGSARRCFVVGFADKRRLLTP